MSFGTILKKLRQDNNLTQDELAKKIDTSRSNIANYENDKNMPSVDILEKLSKLFDCTTDYLLGKSDIRNPEKLKNIPHANSGGVDTTGLDEEDLKELQAQADYMKWKKQNKSENKNKNEDKK